MTGAATAAPAWDRAALVDWLLGEGRAAGDIPTLMEGFCARLVAAGVPLWRCSLGLRLLHPQYRFTSHFWRRGRPAETIERPHGTEMSEEYLASPVAIIVEEKAEALRFPIRDMAAPWPHPIVGELSEQGATDYVVMALTFSNGRRNMVSFATDAPRGFAIEHLTLIDGVLPALAAVVELLALKRLAITVLDTYVGRRTGARILSGDIRRGTGAEVRAVLWYCDLRGFTPLADRLPREELIALLNGYFDIMGGAVAARDGEILKFIGDAMLAVFPLPDGENGAEHDSAVCVRALDAAEEAMAGMARLDGERTAWGQPTLRAGIALHIGDVMYGNIGAPDRLDFTVIGPAVNLVNRIEGLSTRLRRPVLTSAAFARACGDRLESLGYHALKGMPEPIEVFGLETVRTAP